MREDMFKIIVERPRRGWRAAPRARNRLSGEDDLPTKIGVRRHVAITRLKSRWLNENLRPLERYIAKQVGRPWNKVHSEIVATLSPGDVVKEHVRRHIEDFVAHVSVGRDGEWVAHPIRFCRRDVLWGQPYYVDPDDGILKDSAKLWKKPGIDTKRKPKSDPGVRVLDTTRELRCIDGVWYELIFDKRAPTGLNPHVFDLLSKTLVPAVSRHAVAKRQLSRAELRAHGIANIETI